MKECIGCTSCGNVSSVKCYALAQQYHGCPCKKCLVKMVCIERCAELNEFEYQLKAAASRVAKKFWM